MYFSNFFVLSVFCFNWCFAWDSEQLEVFDVVEDVKQNFYEMLNITQDATNQEIKSSFRSLSLKLHPDKNPGVDTSEQFRNLVSVYEILRNANKRRYYDEVLTNGLPNWRSAVYYYRHVRRMGLAEICFILVFIVSIGQYLVGWASYAEQKYTLEQLKKKRKSKKLEKEYTEIEVPKPSLLDTLPIQIPRLIWWIILELPYALVQLKHMVSEAMKKPPVPEPEPEEKIVKPVRKRKPAFVPPEGSSIQNVHTVNNSPTVTDLPPPAPVCGGLWTDDDLDELVQLVKKYPGGTSGRWVIIAEALNRSVSEVTYMAEKMKSNFKTQSEQEASEEVPRIKQKTRAVKLDTPEAEIKKWNRSQQKALEEALRKYPKGCTDRWDRIAECVPNKSKEECMIRIRHLAETFRKQKENPSQPDVLPEALQNE